MNRGRATVVGALMLIMVSAGVIGCDKIGIGTLPDEELPLVRITFSVADHYLDEPHYFIALLRDDKKTEWVFVPMVNVTVALRTDGKYYTSVLIKNSKNHYVRSEYGSAVILVPKEEDIRLWQEELEKLRQDFQSWLQKQYQAPKRVLPEGR